MIRGKKGYDSSGGRTVYYSRVFAKKSSRIVSKVIQHLVSLDSRLDMIYEL